MLSTTGIRRNWPLLALAALLASVPPAPAQSVTQPRPDAAGLSHSTVAAPDGVPLAVTEWGNPEGKPVLLLHGFSFSSDVWRAQQDAALAARYRFVALDLRGHGASGKPWDAASYASSRVWADDIAAVLAAKRLERPVVVAWSFGGNVVMNYVRHYGDANLAGINFIGSTGGLTERLHPLAGDAAYVEGDRLRRSAALVDNIAGQRAFVRLMTATPLSAQDEEVWLFATLQLPRYARAAMAGMPLDNLDLRQRLTVPTLFTTGAADASVPESLLAPLARSLPRSTVSVYAGAGHATFAEQPRRFNQELMAFIDSLRKRDGERPAALVRGDGSIMRTADAAPEWINGVR
ncbi:MAG: alpha/beta hydrolase [Steroidobacteraceae bacterium]